MPPDMKHIILANMNIKLYSWPLNVSQGSAATDLRGGGGCDASFLRRSFLNLTVKNYENWPTVAEVIVKTNLVCFLETQNS